MEVLGSVAGLLLQCESPSETVVKGSLKQPYLLLVALLSPS